MHDMSWSKHLMTCKTKAANAVRFLQPPRYDSVSTAEKYEDSESDVTSRDELLGDSDMRMQNSRTRLYLTLYWLFSGIFFMLCGLMFVTGWSWQQDSDSRCFETANFYCMSSTLSTAMTDDR